MDRLKKRCCVRKRNTTKTPHYKLPYTTCTWFTDTRMCERMKADEWHMELDVLPQDGEADGARKEQGEVWAASVIFFT